MPFAIIHLGQADVTIFGAEVNDESGISVSDAGDVNGDGFDDLLIGARYGDAASNAKNTAGESYLVFGKADWSSTPTIDLANLGSAGVTFYGADAFDYSGRVVSSAGDVNGDGFDDLLIGAVEADAANNAKPRSGESYLVFGKSDWSGTPTIDLGDLGSAGVTFYGADAQDLSGRAVSSAGDINGDGYDDLLIGAHLGDGAGNAKNGAGETVLLFGKADWSATRTVDLGNLGSAGVPIFGANVGDNSGIAVGGAGDVNGDGFDDLLIGARYGDAASNARNAAGESYLVFGKANWSTTLTLDLANLGSAGVIFYGADANDYSGLSVHAAGDVNGDGFDDVLIGAVGGDLLGNATSNAGETYLVFGKADWSNTPTVDLANLGSAGVTFYGNDFQDNSGLEVNGAGDINGDGFDDLLIGARYGDAANNSKTSAGDSYVVFGKPTWTPTVSLGTLGSAGITLFGTQAYDYSGFSVSHAGDVDGDGFDDLLIGAARGDAANNAKSNAGESYLIFGGDQFTASVTHLGTAAANTLTGTSRPDIMVGHRGNDVLIGAGGADVLRGGQGNDLLAVSDLSFRRIVGGTGNDTLRLDGSGMDLDLTTRPDNRIQGIEKIDLSGSGSNILRLNLREVLNLSDESNMLVVLRDPNDTVHRGDGWTRQADQVLSGNTFEVYTQGAATLKLQTSIADLSVTMTASANTIVAGRTFFFTVQATNNGPSRATGVTVTDSLPAGLLFDATNSSEACTLAGQVVTCDLGEMAAGTQSSHRIGVRADPAVPHGAFIQNTAILAGNVTDPTPADRSATVSITVNREADLFVTNTASINPVFASGLFNYVVRIDNRGPSNASGVTVTDTLPDGLTFFPAGSSTGCSAVGQVVTCEVGIMAAGASRSPRIGVAVASTLSSGTVLSNTALVASSELDPTPADRSATAFVTVDRQSNLRVAMTASENPVLAGGAFQYTVQVTNSGPSNATGVTVTDRLPAAVTFDAANSSSSCSAAGQDVACTIGDLAATGSVTQVIAVNVGSALARGAVIRNTATVAGNELDPDLSDQSSSVTVTVSPDSYPWQNLRDPLDVNDDRFVSPIDVLQVINELNFPRHSGVNGRLPVPPPPGARPYLDVSGDNFVAPNDALAVINFLNARPIGEGESSPPADTFPGLFVEPEFFRSPRTLLARDDRKSARFRARLPIAPADEWEAILNDIAEGVDERWHGKHGP